MEIQLNRQDKPGKPFCSDVPHTLSVASFLLHQPSEKGFLWSQISQRVSLWSAPRQEEKDGSISLLSGEEEKRFWFLWPTYDCGYWAWNQRWRDTLLPAVTRCWGHSGKPGGCHVASVVKQREMNTGNNSFICIWDWSIRDWAAHIQGGSSLLLKLNLSGNSLADMSGSNVLCWS